MILSSLFTIMLPPLVRSHALFPSVAMPSCICILCPSNYSAMCVTIVVPSTSHGSAIMLPNVQQGQVNE